MLSGKEFGEFGHGHLGEGGVFEICFLIFFFHCQFSIQDCRDNFAVRRLPFAVCRLPSKMDSQG